MASKLSGYPIENIEHAQVVRYEEGQGFEEHYDTDPSDKNIPSWSRLATFMVYLNDDFIGGETDFSIINNVITPEKGMGLFWWNAVGGELIPESKHKGRYIISGTKWIINTWVHSRNIIDEKNEDVFFDKLKLF
jgi:prolyl 4-hydroxylase